MLQYQNGNTYSYTNDASLLLPVNTWGNSAVTVAREQLNGSIPGLYAVVASQDQTTVTLSPSATGTTVKPGGGVAANGTGTIVLNEGDVLQVFDNGGDVTGTRIDADKPIQTFGGHVCTYIPSNVTACDHLEEAIPPLTAVGKEYIVTVPLIAAGQTKNRMVRVVATEANTTIAYEPAQGGAPTSLTNAGDYFEISQTTADFRITSDKKILVAEYFTGQNAGGNAGDPAMTTQVPIQQYRTNYLVHAPTNYSSSFANVVAPTGATVNVDGSPVSNWTVIGATGYSVARVQLSNAGDGNHTLTSSEKFGITVYGYGQYTSYWYPGGLDLTLIPQ